MRPDLQMFSQKLYPLLFAIIFWGLLLAPIVKPGLDIKNLANDFRWRKNLIEGFNLFRLKVGDRIFPEVIVGEEGWIYYTGQNSIQDYQKTGRWNKKSLKEFQERLDQFNSDLEARGVTLLVVIPPDKSTVYPQYMPAEIPVIGEQSYLDQLADYMHKYGKTQILDLRAPLIEASKTQQVYYKTDSHWNPIGAYIAYREVLSVLSRHYPELQPRLLSDFRLVSGGKLVMDLPRIIGVPTMKEEYWPLSPVIRNQMQTEKIPIDNYGHTIRFSLGPDQSLPRALIYYDSFFEPVIPLLEPHFSHTTSLYHPPPSLDIWNSGWVDQEKPDIVIIEIVERLIKFIPLPIAPKQ